MKKCILTLVILITTLSSWSQKKEKIKGSKIVTHTIKETENFNQVELFDNLEIFFVKGEKCSIEIEADDNLHDAISYSVTNNKLSINATKDVSAYKKFSVRVNYTNDLKNIISHNDSKINALAELNLDNITVKTLDKSQAYLNVKSRNFRIELNDKTNAELNIKADSSAVLLFKEAKAKALVNAQESKIELYQTTKAEIEGDVVNGKVRLDNNSNLIAKKLTQINIVFTAESYSKASVFAKKYISIEASGKSEVELFGEPKVDLLKFTNNATLYKKEKL